VKISLRVYFDRLWLRVMILAVVSAPITAVSEEARRWLSIVLAVTAVARVTPPWPLARFASPLALVPIELLWTTDLVAVPIISMP
jgi:hypothetical protein